MIGVGGILGSVVVVNGIVASLESLESELLGVGFCSNIIGDGIVSRLFSLELL